MLVVANMGNCIFSRIICSEICAPVKIVSLIHVFLPALIRFTHLIKYKKFILTATSNDRVSVVSEHRRAMYVVIHEHYIKLILLKYIGWVQYLRPRYAAYYY